MHIVCLNYIICILINTHRIHGAAIYGNMDPINIPPMLAYIPYRGLAEPQSLQLLLFAPWKVAMEARLVAWSVAG